MLARLEDEIATVLGGAPITPRICRTLPWNAAVIDEAMRLHPPAYMTGREARATSTIGGHRLPAKLDRARSTSAASIAAPTTSRPPLAFRPERMLPDAKKARPRTHYLPFGAGPRVCIGSHFALLEAQLALATMVQRARLRPLVAEHVEPEPLVTLRPRGGLPAIVDAR